MTKASRPFSNLRDLRRYASQTNTRLLIGFILLLFVVGNGLVCIFFGLEAAGMGLICLLVGLAPLSLIWLILKGFDWIVSWLHEGDDWRDG